MFFFLSLAHLRKKRHIYHDSWTWKCFECKWKHLWLKIAPNKTLQIPPLAALNCFFFSSLFLCVWLFVYLHFLLLLLLCECQKQTQRETRDKWNYARSNSKSCILWFRMLRLWINTKGHWIINTLCGGLCVCISVFCRFFCFFLLLSFHFPHSSLCLAAGLILDLVFFLHRI